MDEAENLRRQAKRALRLAESLSDRYANQALAAHAATLLEQAESLEQGAHTFLSAKEPAPQQHKQVHSTEEDQ